MITWGKENDHVNKNVMEWKGKACFSSVSNFSDRFSSAYRQLVGPIDMTASGQDSIKFSAAYKRHFLPASAYKISENILISLYKQDI